MRAREQSRQKARRDDAPVDVGADDEADGDPGFADPHEEDGARKPPQQPAVHVGRTQREGRDETVETAAAENVVAVVASVAVGEKPDAHHDDQIPYEGDRSRIRDHRFCFSWGLRVWRTAFRGRFSSIGEFFGPPRRRAVGKSP